MYLLLDKIKKNEVGLVLNKGKTGCRFIFSNSGFSNIMQRKEKNRLGKTKNDNQLTGIQVAQLGKDDNFSGILMGDHFVYSCTQPSTSDGTRKVLESLNPKDRTLVISGTHGNKMGLTGATDPDLIENDFFYEDAEIIKDLGRTATTTLVAAQNLSTEQIDTAIETGTFGSIKYDNVVLAYCYGRRAMF